MKNIKKIGLKAGQWKVVMTTTQRLERILHEKYKDVADKPFIDFEEKVLQALTRAYFRNLEEGNAEKFNVILSYCCNNHYTLGKAARILKKKY